MKSMKQAKYFLVALLLILLANGSFAAISHPSRVAANANWSFSVSLDSGDTDVFFDDKKIVSVINGQIVKDPFNSQLVVHAAVVDNVLYVSYMGLSKGTYEMRVGDEKAFVEVFDPADASIEENITTKLEQAAIDKDQLMAQINTLERDLLAEKQKVEELQSLLEQTKNSLEETRTELGQTKTTLEQKNTSLSENFSSDIAGLTEKVNKLTAEVFPEPVVLEEEPVEQPKNPLTGLSTFTQKNWIGVFLVLVVTIVVVVVIARKTFFKKETVYDDFVPSGESSDEETFLESDSQKTIEPEEEPESKGKWAFED